MISEEIIFWARACRIHGNSPRKRAHRVPKPPRYTLIFAPRCDSQGNPWHEGVVLRQSIPQKRAQLVDNPPGTIKFALQAMI